MALLNGQVDNRQPLLLGVFHRIRGTSGALGQITNTIAAVIHQATIAFMHTAANVLIRRIHIPVASFLDDFIDGLIRLAPTTGLGFTGENKDKLD